jgi:hypothetical protein
MNPDTHPAADRPATIRRVVPAPDPATGVIDLRAASGDGSDPVAAHGVRYAVLTIHVLGVLGSVRRQEPHLLTEIAETLAGRWAEAQHRPDTLLRVSRSDFCAICLGRSRKQVMDVVDDVRAAAAVPIAQPQGGIMASLSIRILFARS